MDTYLEAEGAREAGDLERAARLFRQVLEQDPAHEKAKDALIRVLSRRAKELRGADPATVLELHREAWRRDPTRRKVQFRYRRTLRNRFVDALRSGEVSVAAELVEIARADDEFGGMDQPLVSSRMASLVPQMPLVPLRSRLGDGSGAPWLVIVDRSIDATVVPVLLDDIGPADVYSFANLRLPFATKPLSRASAFGFHGHDRLYEETGPAVDEIIGALRARLPDYLSRPAGLDLLELLSFRLEDLLQRRTREVLGLQEIVRSGGHELLLLVGGEGGLLAAIRAIHELDPLELPVWELRCPSNADRVDAIPRPVDLDHALPEVGVTRSAPRRELANPSQSTATSHRSRFLSWFRRPRHRRCALMALPDPQHVASLASIASSIDERIEVVGVHLRAGSERADAYRSYEQLVRRRRNTRIALSCCPDAQQREPDVTHLIESALAGADLPSLTLAGYRLGEVVRIQLLGLLGDKLSFFAGLARRVDAFLSAERPDVILVSPDRLPEARIVCALARRRGIPTVFPQLVLLSPSPRNKPLQTDVACVLDDYQARVFEEWCNATQDQVLRTGIARFDPILARRDLGLPDPPGDGTVLLALQPLGLSYNRELIELVVQSVGEADGRLIIKLHPRDAEGSYREYSELVADRMPGRGVVRWKEDIYDLVVESDAVVSTFSNVILEANMLDRPVVCANLTGETLPLPFVEQGLAFGAEGPDEIRRCVARVVRDAAFREEIRAGSAAYFAANPHLLEGRAADRIASIVESLAAGSKVS